MRFGSRQETLLAMLKAVRTVAGKARTIPALSGVLLRVQADGTLEMAGTDGHTGVRVLSLPDVGERETGVIVLAAPMFGDLIAALGPGFVEGRVTAEAPSTLELSYMAGRGKARLAAFWNDPDGIDAYQTPAPVEWRGTWMVAAPPFKRALGQVEYACNPSLGNALSGVRFVLANDEMRLVGADNFRIATRTLPVIPAPGISEAAFTVPAPTIAATKRVLAGKGDVTIGLFADGETPKIQITGDGEADLRVEVTAQLIAEEYPNWQRFFSLPLMQPYCLVAVADLVAALKRVSKIGPNKEWPVRFEWPSADGGLKLSGGEESTGSCEITVDAVTQDQATIPLGVQLLLEFLGTVESEHVRIGLADGGGMALAHICATQLHEGEHIYMLAPRHVPE